MAKAKRTRETGDCAHGAARQIEAIGQRIGKGDVNDLELLGDLEAALEAAKRAAVDGCADPRGAAGGRAALRARGRHHRGYDDETGESIRR